MPTLRVNSTTLSSGITVRIVDNGAGSVPRYVLESAHGQDAMGIMRWGPPAQITSEDMIAALIAVGFLTP